MRHRRIVLALAALLPPAACVGKDPAIIVIADDGTSDGGDAASIVPTGGDDAGSIAAIADAGTDVVVEASLDAGADAKSCATPAECGSGGECGDPACVGGKCTLVPRPADAGCGTGNRCDGAGRCVACLLPAHCPQPSGECRRAACNAGVCGIENLPPGAFCNGLRDQCDGNGSCVDCFNNGGCDECCVCLNKTCVPA